jgi:hypothetical protein
MTNENEAQRFIVDSPLRLRGEETPDVEGHIRKVHTANEVRVEEPAGPAAAEDDGPDVEGHILRF